MMKKPRAETHLAFMKKKRSWLRAHVASCLYEEAGAIARPKVVNMENEDLKKLMKLVDEGYDVRMAGVEKGVKLYIGRTPIQRNAQERDIGIASMF